MKSKIRPIVHLKMLIYRPIPSMGWMVHDQKFVRSSILELLSWSSVRICPWDGRSENKFRSVVHVDWWTDRRSADGRLRPWRPAQIFHLTVFLIMSQHTENRTLGLHIYSWYAITLTGVDWIRRPIVLLGLQIMLRVCHDNFERLLCDCSDIVE